MVRTIIGNKQLKKVRTKLRLNMTTPEQVLWYHLRQRQFHDLKFRRQHGIGNYVVDFYCPEMGLVIELDGETHGEPKQKANDAKRDLYLRSLGLKVHRYFNGDIMHDLEGVLEDLWNKISVIGSTPSDSPLQRGRTQRS